MPELHQRGVEMVTDLLDAADNIERLPADELKALLREAALVLGDLLARDKPSAGPPD